VRIETSARSFNPQSAIRDPQSPIWTPQSAFRDPQSAIWTPRSAITDPRCAFPATPYHFMAPQIGCAVQRGHEVHLVCGPDGIWGVCRQMYFAIGRMRCTAEEAQ
jgi:hypothetical protein